MGNQGHLTASFYLRRCFARCSFDRMHGMTGFQSQNSTAAQLPEAMSQMQRRIEQLYLSQKALERDVQRLTATQPIFLSSPARPWLPMRLLRRCSGRLQRRYHIRLIRMCGLFEAEWYLNQYDDVRQDEADPVVHYLDHGSSELRNPGPYFDTAHYLHLYPDIAQNGMNPLLHYLISGFDESRSIRPGMPHGDDT